MRLTIFSRLMLAQSILIALILTLSLYALAKLHLLSQLNTTVLTVDTASINEGKRLLKAFLTEMRNAEKYLLTRDAAFFEGYAKGQADFADALSNLAPMIVTESERELFSGISALHTLYTEELEGTISGRKPPDQAKLKSSEAIIDMTNELIRLREQAASAKTAAARDQAASAAEVMLWLTLFGIAGALVSAFLHARGVNNPLKKLAQEMRLVGQGEFTRATDSQGPKEVRELSRAFNRMSEELEHLDRLKADFTAHVSHELRTPLTAIREGTALLLEEVPGPLTQPQREILDVVRSHSDRLFHSITSILDLSKMESKMMDYEFAMCDLGALMEKSVASFDLIARKQGIALSMGLRDRLPMLLVDERRVQQVLDNLLSNALKFTPRGGAVRVDAWLGGMNREGAAFAEVAVSDTGAGIPRQELGRIFDHFYQSTSHKAQSKQGTGLGLAIARHIVEAHGGRIWAESETGRGATFHFTLPVRAGIDGAAKAQANIFEENS